MATPRSCFPLCRPLRLLLILSLALLSAAAAPAQENDPVHIVPLNQRSEAPAAPAVGEDTQSVHLKPFRVDVDLVLVPVTVTDVKGRPVLGLKQQDFQLPENEQRQPIESFSSEDVPISVGVILDLS